MAERLTENTEANGEESAEPRASASSANAPTPAASSASSLSRWFARWRDLLLRLSMMPLVFLGVGVYRAWIATLFRFGVYPGVMYADYALFEASIGVASFVCAALARRIAPLWCNRKALVLTIVLTTAGSALIALACLGAPGPEAPAALLTLAFAAKIVGLISAGAGLGILILLWCEFYGALNPMRVAVFHALGIMFGELLIWLFMGLRAEWIVVFSLTLPAIAVGCVHRSDLQLMEYERPMGFAGRARAGRNDAAENAPTTDVRAIPWKPIALMATCTFAMQYGTFPGQPVVLGNVLGELFATVFVTLGVLSNSRWFNFDTIYRVAFPLITVACMLAAPLQDNPQVAAWCFDAGYTMLSMYIMIILSNITYRFGINAVWLNGIERGIRYIVETLGWMTYLFSSRLLSGEVEFAIQMTITVAVVVVFGVIVFSEKELSARWGVNLKAVNEEEGGQILPFSGMMPENAARSARKLTTSQLSMRVSELSEAHGLSDREEEVLQLMARRVPMRQMEEQLFVAEGTIKAHTSRIYRKLGVHSRSELFEMLGVDEETDAVPR
jgi:DNA-binding CsgD family transcriptional regulator